MRLNELAKKYSTDKKIKDGVKCQNGLFGHGYVTDYEEILKNKDIKSLLEIGVSFGGSLKMWDEYFNYNCEILGIDIEEKRFKKSQLENERIKIKIGDQSNEEFLKTLGFKNYDIIIDDGSHIPDHQLISFKILFEFLNKGGIYVIEDLHVSEKTKNIFYKIKLKESDYFSENILNEILNVEFYSNDKICVIYKK